MFYYNHGSSSNEYIAMLFWLPPTATEILKYIVRSRWLITAAHILSKAPYLTTRCTSLLTCDPLSYKVAGHTRLYRSPLVSGVVHKIIWLPPFKSIWRPPLKVIWRLSWPPLKVIWTVTVKWR